MLVLSVFFFIFIFQLSHFPELWHDLQRQASCTTCRLQLSATTSSTCLILFKVIGITPYNQFYIIFMLFFSNFQVDFLFDNLQGLNVLPVVSGLSQLDSGQFRLEGKHLRGNLGKSVSHTTFKVNLSFILKIETPFQNLTFHYFSSFYSS